MCNISSILHSIYQNILSQNPHYTETVLTSWMHDKHSMQCTLESHDKNTHNWEIIYLIEVCIICTYSVQTVLANNLNSKWTSQKWTINLIITQHTNTTLLLPFELLQNHSLYWKCNLHVGSIHRTSGCT